MARIGAFVCLVIVGMDVAAGILGIEAEKAKNKVTRRILGSFECKDPRSDAFKLGLAAAILLAIAHIAANLLGAFTCICCMEELERLSNNRQLWFACLIFSWFVVAIGFPMLIMGTIEISKSRGTCTTLLNGFLSVGGILCFVHGLFCIAFYVSATVRFGNERPNGHDAFP